MRIRALIVNEFVDRMQPNMLEQLVENAKKLHVWALNSRGPVYTGTVQSTLRNKRAYRWKATSGSKRITEMLVLEERNLWIPGLKRKCNACTQRP